MRSVEEQLAIITDAAVTPEPVRIAIAEALGLTSAEEVQATDPLPAFPLAAVDGYAVRAVDVGGERGLGHQKEDPADDEAGDSEDTPAPVDVEATERSLPVVGEVPAGSRQPLRLDRKSVV